MKRKFLEDMGLSKEQVDNIMAENGRDIEAIKTERDNYKTQRQYSGPAGKSYQADCGSGSQRCRVPEADCRS